MGVYLGHQPRDDDESVSQHQIEAMNNELDNMYDMVETMLKQVKQNTQVINNMMEWREKVDYTHMKMHKREEGVFSVGGGASKQHNKKVKSLSRSIPPTSYNNKTREPNVND